MDKPLLGIEIGGTKLQFGIGTGTERKLVALQRYEVDRAGGANGIRQAIIDAGRNLIDEHGVQRIGIGFGGPVDTRNGRTIHSFQIDGWDDFPLRDWSERVLGLPTVVENDSNLAGLAEARFGAGHEAEVVFYSNVGSGIGGALVIQGRLYPGGSGVAVAEIGHLRPGPQAIHPDETVESVSSGWGIAHGARQRLEDAAPMRDHAMEELWTLCEGHPEQLTTRLIADALARNNSVAREVFDRGIRTYGWALAQVVTLLSPNVLVIGGGVAQLHESLFLDPLRQYVERYVMPPLCGSYQILPADLGEEVVVHGALALAATLANSQAGG